MLIRAWLTRAPRKAGRRHGEAGVRMFSVGTWLVMVSVLVQLLLAGLGVFADSGSLLLAPYHMDAQGVLRAVSGLHVLNAILIFWVSIQLVEQTRTWLAGASPGAAHQPAATDDSPGAASEPAP